MGESIPKIQIAPVLKNLIFPKSKQVLLGWLEKIKTYKNMEYLISAHYSAPVKFSEEDCQDLIEEINSDKWYKLPDDNKFLINFYKKLFELGIIPKK